MLGVVALTVLASVFVLSDDSDAAPGETADVGIQFRVDENRYEVTADGEVAFIGVTDPLSTTSVDIPTSVSYGTDTYSVTHIGGYAFEGFTMLTSVTIPDSVVYIDDYAFFNSNIESINIPESVTYIGDFSFYGLLLDSMSIPESVIHIGESAFCSSWLTSVTFESSEAPYIGADAFMTGTTINVYTPGWDPVAALADAHGDETTIVWVNAPQPEIGDVFEYDGIYYRVKSDTTVIVASHPDKTSSDGIYSGDVVIPATVTFGSTELDVAGIATGAFLLKPDINQYPRGRDFHR